MLDAIENLHRLDREFLRELVARHKSGLDILAGSEQFDRPDQQDAAAIEELFRVLARQYDYIVVDAGNMINSARVSALYTADTIFWSPTRTCRRSGTRSAWSTASASSAPAASASGSC